MTEADRDEKVTQAYRALGGEAPPRALDEAILAASRRPRARWRVPLSIAAVLVLAVGVTLRMLPPQPGAESVALAPQVMETPRPAAVPAPAAADNVRRADMPTSAAAPAPRSAPAGTLPPTSGAAQRETADRAAKNESARREAFAGAAAVPQERAAAVGVEPQARMRDAAPAPSARPALSAAKLAEPARTPEAWLERIAEMRKQGREREAQESLAEFKKRYPDYKIPEALTR
ncbi:MAG TPA: hypothetical protein VFP62_10185 [Burkholderiales bacterium]|jgi:hypothetical protein|nr:hypothetical protein [Burkholderiales bacterium]